MQTTLQAMQLTWQNQARILADQGYAGRQVLGYKLPSWQRLESWSDDQAVRFITSCWMGVGIGTFMVNYCANEALSLILLDGQQRFRSLERYWCGELAIVGEDGNAYTWHDLTESEQNRFMRISFPWIETGYRTEEELCEAYNRHNFGGTPHKPDEVARPGL